VEGGGRSFCLEEQLKILRSNKCSRVSNRISPRYEACDVRFDVNFPDPSNLSVNRGVWVVPFLDVEVTVLPSFFYPISV